MKAQGYEFDDPMAPLLKYSHIAKPSNEEVATAANDVQCKTSTNLVGVAIGLQSALDNQYIRAHVTQLSGFTSSLRELLRTAGRAG